MNILNSNILNRRALYLMAAILVVVAAFLPALTSAAQITQRSVQLSSASAGAENVTYGVNFTPTVGAGAFVVDFCANTPIVGETCTAPAGFSATARAITSTSVGFTDVAALDANTVRVTGAMTQGTPVSVAINGLDNPDEAGTIYARIVTYTNANDANNYESEELGNYIDDGGVAIAITDTIGVSGSVLESLQFCVSGEAIDQGNCTGVENLDSPNLALGDVIGDANVLQPGQLSTGELFAQISTNAVGGAIVSLKSSTTGCGGLTRVGAANCDIRPISDSPLNVSGIESAANGLFGLLVSTSASDPATNANPEGTLRAVGSYNATNYYLGWSQQNEATVGVTSLYGDPIFDTDDAPVTDKNVQFTFGASAQNNTPAGNYAADMSMIATGKF